MSRKLLVLAILLILGGALISGCVCCCRSPDYGTYSPPKIPRLRATPTPIVVPSVTIMPVVVPATPATPSPVVNVTALPNTTKVNRT